MRNLLQRAQRVLTNTLLNVFTFLKPISVPFQSLFTRKITMVIVILALTGIIYLALAGSMTALTFVGGLFAGLALYGWWSHSEPNKISATHLALLNTQHTITELRITEAQKKITSVCENTQQTMRNAQEAILATTPPTITLQSTYTQLAATLAEALKLKESTGQEPSSFPDLAQISTEIQLENEAAAKRVGELTELVTQLIQITATNTPDQQEEIRHLQALINKKNEQVEQLKQIAMDYRAQCAFFQNQVKILAPDQAPKPSSCLYLPGSTI